MVLNSCIMAGFLLLFVAEFLRLGDSRGTSAVLGRLGYALIAFSLLLFAFAPRTSWPMEEPAAAPNSAAVTGIPALLLAAGAILSALLLIWSVFLEFSWVRRKRKLAPEATVDSGTYGLCRHPGFWWLSFLVIFLNLLRGVRLYSIATILMIALDFVLVFVQDRYIFPRILPGYEEYRKRVPFLIPGKGERN